MNSFAGSFQDQSRDRKTYNGKLLLAPRLTRVLGTVIWRSADPAAVLRDLTKNFKKVSKQQLKLKLPMKDGILTLQEPKR